MRQTLKAHVGGITSVAFSPDGQWLASASLDKTVKIWDLSSSAPCIRSFPFDSSVGAVAFLADNRRIAVGLCDGDTEGSKEGEECVLQFWDIESGLCVERLPDQKGPIWSIALSPNGKMLASTSGLKVSMWGVAQTPTQLVWKVDAATDAVLNNDGNQNYIRTVSFSSDGQHLSSVAYNGTVEMWNAANGSRLWTTEIGAAIPVATFVGESLATNARSHHLIKLLDRTNGTCIQTLNQKGRVCSIVDLGRRRFASSDGDGKIHVWDEKGAFVQDLQGHSGIAYSLAFSAARQLLASGSLDEMVGVWDLSSISVAQQVEEVNSI